MLIIIKELFYLDIINIIALNFKSLFLKVHSL